MSESKRSKSSCQLPGDYVMPKFGIYKGEPLSQIPVDYLAVLVEKSDLYDGPKNKVRAYLAWLRKNPGKAWITFGKYDGTDLAEVPTWYLDQAMGWEKAEGMPAELQAFLDWWEASLLKELCWLELRRRRTRVPVYDDRGLFAGDKPVRRGVALELEELPWLTKREDVTGGGDFSPTDNMGGGGKKPSCWFVTKKWVDENTLLSRGEVLDHLRSFHTMFAKVKVGTEDGLALRWMPRGRRDNKDSVSHWMFVLELIDGFDKAQDKENLKRLYDEARHACRNLCVCEGPKTRDWKVLREMLDSARGEKLRRLEAGEETLGRKYNLLAADRGEGEWPHDQAFDEADAPRKVRCKGRRPLRIEAYQDPKERAEAEPPVDGLVLLVGVLKDDVRRTKEALAYVREGLRVWRSLRKQKRSFAKTRELNREHYWDLPDGTDLMGEMPEGPSDAVYEAVLVASRQA